MVGVSCTGEAVCGDDLQQRYRGGVNERVGLLLNLFAEVL